MRVAMMDAFFHDVLEFDIEDKGLPPHGASLITSEPVHCIMGACTKVVDWFSRTWILCNDKPHHDTIPGHVRPSHAKVLTLTSNMLIWMISSMFGE